MKFIGCCVGRAEQKHQAGILREVANEFDTLYSEDAAGYLAIIGFLFGLLDSPSRKGQP